MPNIRFGEIDFSGDGAFVWGAGQYSAPARSVDFIEVPGRNGDLLIDNGSYTNTKAVYRVVITKNVAENVDRLKYLLYSQKGYQRLYDSDLKGFYRMACFCGGFDLTSIRGGVVYIEFECKPYKYDINGETPIVFDLTKEDQLVVYNPYFETAHPLIKLYGSAGSIYWNERETQISDGGEGHIIIDTDALDAYSFSVQEDGNSKKVNRNKGVSDLDLYLEPGDTLIRFPQDTEWHTLEIVPRWVTI